MSSPIVAEWNSAPVIVPAGSVTEPLEATAIEAARRGRRAASGSSANRSARPRYHPLVAGTRTSPKADVSSPPPSSKQGDQLRGVLVEAARTQLAAVSAGIKFWAGWVESADKYTRAINDELAKLEEAGESSDIVGRISDLTREYLRNMTQLPSAAVKEFNSQLETIGKPKAKRTRAARAKE